MKLSRIEVLRRAVSAAHRAATAAHTAAWRARRKMGEAHEAAKAYTERGCPGTSIKAFVLAESERLRAQAEALENASWAPGRELLDLKEFMGCEKEGT